MNTYIFQSNQPLLSLGHCLILSIAYVGSLYIGNSPYSRDHPDTIKQRIRGVIFVCLLAPFYLSFCMINDENGHTLITWLGLDVDQILLAAIQSLVLTMILFTGPIVLYFVQYGFKDGFKSIKLELETRGLIFYRTYVVAPFTEEFIFRACLLPLLVPNFGINKSIILAPLFFGVAHFHHVIEQLRMGKELISVCLVSCFQMFYTTVFGAYTAFLFLRTGHLVGPVLCHSFCNMMGFPEFECIPTCKYPKFVCFSFVLGLVLFFYLLFPMTNPDLFRGSVYLS